VVVVVVLLLLLVVVVLFVVVVFVVLLPGPPAGVLHRAGGLWAWETWTVENAGNGAGKTHCMYYIGVVTGWNLVAHVLIHVLHLLVKHASCG